MSNVTYSPNHRQDGTPLLNTQSALRTAPDVCTSVSLAVLFGSNSNSYIVFTQSDMWIYTHILNNLETPIGQKKYFKKLGQQCMPCVKEIFRSAILDTRAIGSSSLAYVVNSSFLLLLCFHVITVHWQRELLMWRLNQRHVVHDPEIFHDNKTQNM